MMKRLFCFLLILALFFSFASAEEEKPASQRYDLDLTFSLNPDAFPARSRSRARGYADLLDALELRGDITICEATESFDMNAVLFFRNKPEVSIPFRFYGTPRLLFLTSPVIADETLQFNMIALAEFAIKVKKSLDTPLPALALLYPVVYEHNLWYVREAFNQYTGPGDVSREISTEQITKLADVWADLLENDTNLNVWMNALYSVSSAPEAVEAELNGIPSYLKDFVSAGEPITVEINDGSETWKNGAGQTLFSREKTDKHHTWSLTLPADENRYVPTVTFTRTNGEDSFSFTLDGSMIRNKTSLLPPGLDDQGFQPLEEEEESESEYEDEEDSQWPETMVKLSASGTSLPLSFPCDASFSLAASIEGALYPNFSLSAEGKTEKNGSVSVSVSIPQESDDPVTLLKCEGTIVPGTAESVPDYNYTSEQLYGTYNFFSFSEYYMAKFKNAVTKTLVKSLLDFVAEAPTSACQSLLDDLTDSGIMNMMLLGQ